MADTQTKHLHGEYLSAYLDGMLDIARMRSVASHLNACAACRAEYQSFQATKSLLHEAPAPAAPPQAYWDDTFRRMRTEAAPHPLSLLDSLRGVLDASQRRWAAGVAAFAVVAALIGVPLAGNHTVQPKPIVAAQVQDSLDVTGLVRSHAAFVAQQPLGDPDRQAMISADAQDDFGSATDTVGEAGHASGSAADAAP